MLCYKDRTFCASTNCKNECNRQLTDEIRQGARASKYMLSLAYFCGEPKNESMDILKYVVTESGTQ